MEIISYVGSAGGQTSYKKQKAVPYEPLPRSSVRRQRKNAADRRFELAPGLERRF